MSKEVKAKLFEEFTIKANTLGNNQTLTLLVQAERANISVQVHKYDLEHKDWYTLFEEHLEGLEKLCKDFNIPFTLGSVKVVKHYYSERFVYGKLAVSTKERKRQLNEARKEDSRRLSKRS